MNALQPSRPPLYPVEPARRRSRRTRTQRQQQHSQAHRIRAVEVGAKLAVNAILAITALSALVRLTPDNFNQQNEMKRLQRDVALVERRVSQLQEDFNRRFDPQQMRNVMQEQSIRMDPNQRQVFWVQPTDASMAASAQQPHEP